MPEGVSLTFIGLDEAMADLTRWADEVAPAVEEGTASFRQTVRSKVAGRVPVLTGTLAGSVTTTDEPDGFALGYSGAASYAGWIEFGGSRGRPAVPEGRYLYPTAQAAESEFISLATDIATDTVGRFSWSTP